MRWRVLQLVNTQLFNNFSRVIRHPGEMHKHLIYSALRITLFYCTLFFYLCKCYGRV